MHEISWNLYTFGVRYIHTQSAFMKQSVYWGPPDLRSREIHEDCDYFGKIKAKIPWIFRKALATNTEEITNY